MVTKSGYITIIGRPNAGKSTLMNALLGERLSIITNKPQTTRKRILGILTEDECQMIFLDTPGILKPNYLLQEKFLEYVNSSIRDADIIILIIDVSEEKANLEFFDSELIKRVITNDSVKKIAVINKIDLADEAIVNKLVAGIEKLGGFEKIIPVSATKDFNIDSVKSSIKELLSEGPQFYPEDQLTDGDERFFVSEIIREKVFEKYKEEIPFSVEVVVEEFKERENSKDFISASIIVERESQKPIIIGKKGDSIKRLGQVAREAVEQFLQREVFLELRVKVRTKWRSNPNMLKSFGYTADND